MNVAISEVSTAYSPFGGVVMYEDRKSQALATWHKLLDRSDIQMTAQEQYEELLRLAEVFLK
jgi:hypothetical protein